MASTSLSAALVHPFGSGSTSAGVDTSLSGSSSVSPPPAGLLDSASHSLISHRLVMKNERLQHHQQQHRLYQPYNHLPLHHHHPHHHLAHQQHLLDNHYELGQHYPVASTSGGGIGGGTESRCSSVSSSGGADHHSLALKNEQPQSSSLESSSLELLDSANVSLYTYYNQFFEP